MIDKSAFVMAFGDAPTVKVIDFLIAERGLYDFTLTEIAENSGVSWTTLHKIFPMFEFESHGSIDDLQRLESELVEHLGLKAPARVQYEAMSKQYDAPILEAEQEEQMSRDLGPCISLERFPGRTHPFWNMKECGDGTFAKIDVILYGQETIGSAERSSNITEMRHNFNTVSNGEYAETLFRIFGRERVMEELDEYLSLPMIPRFGGGIGITRLVRAMREARLV